MSDQTKVVHISGKDEFQKEVLDSKIPVMIDFSAEWCGPCQMAIPVLNDLSIEFDGRLKIVGMDVDDPANREISGQHGVMSIPTVVIYKQGKAVPAKEGGVMIGFDGEDGYRRLIENNLAA